MAPSKSLQEEEMVAFGFLSRASYSVFHEDLHQVIMTRNVGQKTRIYI